MSCATPCGSLAAEPQEDPEGQEGNRKGRRDTEEEEEVEGFKASYVSCPEPPPGLWDKDDARFLERVKCHAIVRVTEIDPQLSTYKVRMKCHWAFRTLNSQEGAELRWRGIPHIRMPGLRVDIEESRIWKDLTKTSKGELRTNAVSVYWRGTSTFAISGFKTFQMKDFPFDRQVIDLERLEFVWRDSGSDKQSLDDYYKRMQVVKFTVKTSSMLPEWGAYDALIEVREESARPASSPTPSITSSPSLHSDPPTFASSFSLKLRIERKHWFYVRQVFFVTYLITLVSCAPLCMPPEERHMGDRLSLYGGGLLTLVAFKYGIAEHLPSVPYATFTDDFLLYQILTITLCCFETLFAYRLPKEEDQPSYWSAWDQVENGIFFMLVAGWTLYTIYAAFVAPNRRRPWCEVLRIANDYDHEFELHNPDDEEQDLKKRI